MVVVTIPFIFMQDMTLSLLVQVMTLLTVEMGLISLSSLGIKVTIRLQKLVIQDIKLLITEVLMALILFYL